MSDVVNLIHLFYICHPVHKSLLEHFDPSDAFYVLTVKIFTEKKFHPINKVFIGFISALCKELLFVFFVAGNIKR